MKCKIITLLLFCSVVVNIIWAVIAYGSDAKDWLVYKIFDKPYPLEITIYKNLYPKLLMEDGYHYVYWVEDDERNTSAFPNYFTSDGREYIDLGLAPDERKSQSNVVTY